MSELQIPIGLLVLAGALGYLIWEWWNRNVEIKHLKTDLRNAQPRVPVLRRTTEEMWVHGKAGALLANYGVPVVLLGLAGAAITVGYLLGRDTGVRPVVPVVTPRAAVIDSIEHNRQMNELLHQMYRGQVAHSIMVEELNCVIDRMDDGEFTEDAREICRRAVQVRRDSLANTP